MEWQASTSPKANFINKVSLSPKKKSIKILVVHQLSAQKVPPSVTGLNIGMCFLARSDSRKERLTDGLSGD
jgi:hypothetical protein